MDGDNSFALNSIVEMDGEHYTFIGTEGGHSAILHKQGEPAGTGYRKISLKALYELIGPAKSSLDYSLRPSGGAWEPRVVEMAAHLREMDEGSPRASDGKPRREYDPTIVTKLNDRVDNKIQELSGTSLRASRSTLFRYLRQFRRGGLPALSAAMDTNKPAQKRARLRPELAAIIVDVLVEQTDAPTKTMKSHIKEIRRRARKFYPDEVIDDVSDKTIARYIAQQKSARNLSGLATTRRTAGNRPDREFATNMASRPGQLVEIDSTPLDVQVRDQHGTYRPHLTLMWDVATAIPLAWEFHPAPPKGVDHALLLGKALIPRKAVPGREATRLAASATLPFATMQKVLDWMDEDTLALPFIWPEEITVDGGADYRSGVFQDACLSYGITLNLAAPGSATQKPHVERAFRTIRQGFSEALPGYVAQGPAHRGKLDDPVFTLAELEVLFELWVSTVYLNSPSAALPDPMDPSTLWTPNQKYAALFMHSGQVRIPFEPDDYIRLLDTTMRTIQDDGVHLSNRVYTAPGLTRYPRTLPNGKARKWPIRFNPHDLTTVWIHDLDSDGFLQLTDRSINWMNAPFAKDISDFLASGGAPADPNLAQNVDEFIDTVTAKATKARRRRHERRKTDRLPRPEVVLPTKPELLEPDTVDLSAIPDLGIIEPGGDW